jgi:hypothetical protein
VDNEVAFFEFKIPGDWSSAALKDKVIVGYEYKYEVELPRT